MRWNNESLKVAYRSFKMVRREFNMAELALKISSKKATLAVGKYPAIFRMYLSSSRAANISTFRFLPSHTCRSSKGNEMGKGIVFIYLGRAGRITPRGLNSASRVFRKTDRSLCPYHGYQPRSLTGDRVHFSLPVE